MVIYYLWFHPTGAIRVWRRRVPEDTSDTLNFRGDENGKKGKKQISSSIWINQGRVLHPRPAVPTMSSSNQESVTTNTSNSGGGGDCKNKVKDTPVKELRLPPLSLQ